MTLNLKIWNSLTPHPTVQVNATSVSSFPDRLDRRRLDTVHWRGSGSPPGSAAFGVGHSYHVGFDHELAWWHCTPCHFEPEWQRLDGTVLAEELVWSVLAAQLTYPMHHRFNSHYTGYSLLQSFRSLCDAKIRSIMPELLQFLGSIRLRTAYFARISVTHHTRRLHSAYMINDSYTEFVA